MAIHDWPVTERPREKLLARGAASLSEAELLAIFLRSGVAGTSAVGLARQLLKEYGGLRPLLEADRHSLCRISGLGPAKYAQLKAVLELGRRYLGETLRRDAVLNNPEATRRYLTACLRDSPHELFACLFLDTRHRVITFDILFQGTIDGATVHPREVVRRAMQHNAAAVILAHNHPSGVAEPSRADEHLTRRLRDALDLVDIRILDHIIVGDGEMTSLAERGLI